MCYIYDIVHIVSLFDQLHVEHAGSVRKGSNGLMIESSCLVFKTARIIDAGIAS